MTEIQDILDEVRKAGVTLEVSGERLLADPAGVLSESLKVRLRERRPDIIRALTTGKLELEASRNRLEGADIRVAVFINETDSGLRITGERMVQGEAAAREYWKDSALVFTPSEMWSYVYLNEAERKLFLGLKRIGKR